MTSPRIHRSKAELARRKRYWRIVAIAAVAIIAIPPLVGVSGTTMAFLRLFGEVSSPDSMHRDMPVGDISRPLRLTLVALGVSVMGVVLLALAMVRRAQLQRQDRTDAG